MIQCNSYYRLISTAQTLVRCKCICYNLSRLILNTATCVIGLPTKKLLTGNFSTSYKRTRFKHITLIISRDIVIRITIWAIGILVITFKICFCAIINYIINRRLPMGIQRLSTGFIPIARGCPIGIIIFYTVSGRIPITIKHIPCTGWGTRQCRHR